MNQQCLLQTLEEEVDDPNPVLHQKPIVSSSKPVNCKRSTTRESYKLPRKKTKDSSTCTHAIFSSLEDFEETGIDNKIDNRFGCLICGKFFASKSTLNTHKLRHKNREDLPHKCNHCSIRFVTRLELRRHETSHSSEKNYLCTVCGQSFLRDMYLREHMDYVHKQSVALICGICNFQTYRRKTMKTHLKIHSGLKSTVICHICNATLSSKGALKEHLMSHADAREFECPECGKKFNNNRYLTSHKNIVHTPKSHVCSHCSKSFATLPNLRRHELIHTGEKPYACCFCPYSCNAQGNIVKHIRLLHQKTKFTYKDYIKQMGPPTTLKELQKNKTKQINKEGFKVQFTKSLKETTPAIDYDSHQIAKMENNCTSNSENLIPAKSYDNMITSITQDDVSNTTSRKLCKVLIGSSGSGTTTNISQLDLEDEVSHLDIFIDTTNSHILTNDTDDQSKAVKISNLSRLKETEEGTIPRELTFLNTNDLLPPLQIITTDSTMDHDIHETKSNENTNIENLFISVTDNQIQKLLNVENDSKNINNVVLLSSQNASFVDLNTNNNSFVSSHKKKYSNTTETSNSNVMDLSGNTNHETIVNDNDRIIVYSNSEECKRKEKESLEMSNVGDMHVYSILNASSLVEIDSNLSVIDYSNNDNVGGDESICVNSGVQDNVSEFDQFCKDDDNDWSNLVLVIKNKEVQ